MDYLKAKGHHLPQTFDWRDMAAEAHATGFTVAKSTGFDILKDIHSAVVKAQEQGLTLKQFQQELTPILQAKGWWGRKEMADPKTGEIIQAQLGSPRRLQIIYDTNMRMSYAAGRWAQMERVKARRPYLRYVSILDGRTRPLHRQWHGTVLPMDHPWWRTHFPPNGWRCRCTVQQLSQRDLDEFGYQVSPDPDDEMVPWTNDRTGDVVMTPRGVDPGFGYNPGQVAVQEHATRALMGKLVDAPAELAAAQAASARFAVPALQRDFEKWVDGVAVSGARAKGEIRVVGALSQEVLDAVVERRGFMPESGAIVVSDAYVLHQLRDVKVELGKAPGLDEVRALPSHLAEPLAVLWDKGKANLVYVFNPAGNDRRGKFIVEVDWRQKLPPVDGKRARIATNMVISSGLVEEHNLREGHFEILAGMI